tara:strand:- start:27 stop:356 length:330 start_codon:yes stop_codon:yes gene_type:complete
MADLVTKIELYCKANNKTAVFEENVFLMDNDDGKGVFINKWSVDGLTKPTDEQLASYEKAGNTVEANNKVRMTRRLAYGDIGEQLDEIYKDIDAWKARIKKIKDDNPKG